MSDFLIGRLSQAADRRRKRVFKDQPAILLTTWPDAGFSGGSSRGLAWEALLLPVSLLAKCAVIAGSLLVADR